MDLLWVFCLSQIKECPEDMSRNDRNDQNYTLECRVKSIRWLFLHWIVLFFDEKRGKSILEFNSFFKKFVNEYCMYLYILVIKQAWSSVYWVYSFIILHGKKNWIHSERWSFRPLSSTILQEQDHFLPLPRSNCCSIDLSCRYPIRNRCFHHHYRKNPFSSRMSTLLLPVRLSVFFSSLPLSSIYYLSKKKEKIHISFTSKILF